MIQGKIFRGISQKDLLETRPIYAFVPKSLITKDGYNQKEYSLRGWDSINCGANKYAIGSHLFPDTSKPISSAANHSKVEIAELKEFIANLKRLIQKHKGRLNEFKKPGKQEPEPKQEVD